MLKIILLLVVVAVAVFVVLVLKQPDEFRVTRSLAMKATPATVFAQVNNLRNWQAWSPWAKLDPTAKTEFSGPVEGKDAAMSWDGNNKVGKGTMTIVDSQSDKLVKFKLDFLKPMQATNYAEFSFTPQGDQTLVSWTMYGTSNFIGKAMSVLFNCEKMVGSQFDQGLADLKTIVEAKP